MTDYVDRKIKILKERVKKYHKKYGIVNDLVNSILEFIADSLELLYSTGYIKCYIDIKGLEEDKDEKNGDID